MGVASALATHGALYLADHCTQGQQPRRSCAPSEEGFFQALPKHRAARALALAPTAPGAHRHENTREHPSRRRSSDGRAVLDVFQCLMSRMGRGAGGGQTHRSLY